MPDSPQKKYRIEVARTAEKALLKIGERDRSAISKKIDALAENPRPNGHKKLKGQDNLYRIRVGNYRVIYQIHEGELLILVVRIGDRKDVYWDT